MKWLILFVVGVVAAEDQQKLAERIVSTEQECDRLYKLNENWNINNYNELVVLYVDLFFLCEDSLAENKYAYIDHNHEDLTVYTKEDDTFPVMTGEGEEWVKKPPARSDEDEETMVEKLSDYLHAKGDKFNPLIKLASIQSELGQEIVDQQVSCELLGLLMLKGVDLQVTTIQHTACMNKLNCLKERFMVQHGFTLETYPNFFPILYKGRGTMLNSPPPLTSSGIPLCVQPVHPHHYKKEMQKWSDIKVKLETVGQTAEEELGSLQNTGTGLINTLKRIGMSGAPRLLKKEQIKKEEDGVVSGVLVKDDQDNESEPKSPVKTTPTVETQTVDDAAELESDEVNFKRLDRMNEIKTNTLFNPIDKLSFEAGDYLKNKEANKLKSAFEKTMKSLSDAEYEVKIKSETAKEEIENKVGLANDAAELATKKLKEDGSILLDKLKQKIQNIQETEVPEKDQQDLDSANNGWLSGFVKNVAQEYLPKNFDNAQNPVLEKMLKRMRAQNEEGEDLLTDEHIINMLNNLEKDIKEKAETMNMHHKEEIKQAALAFKGVLHSVLDAGLEGYGPAKGMTSQEIIDAKSLINLVDFATQENTVGNAKERHSLRKPLEKLHRLASPTTPEESVPNKAEKEEGLEKSSQKEPTTIFPEDGQESVATDIDGSKDVKDGMNKPQEDVPSLTPPIVREEPTASSSAVEVIDLTQDDSDEDTENSTGAKSQA